VADSAIILPDVVLAKAAVDGDRGRCASVIAAHSNLPTVEATYDY
jgi:hypothetical protein